MSRRLHISEVEEAARLIRWISALRKIEIAIEQQQLDGAKLSAGAKSKDTKREPRTLMEAMYENIYRPSSESLTAWLQAPFVLIAIGEQIRALEAAVISLGVEI